MGKKQKELEATVLLEIYDLVAVIEARWDESHDWSAGIDDCRLFGRDIEEGGAERLPSMS